MSPQRDSRWYSPGSSVCKITYTFEFTHYEYLREQLDYHDLLTYCTVEEVLEVVLEAFIDYRRAASLTHSRHLYGLVVEEHALNWLASRGIQTELGGNRTTIEELIYEGVLSVVQELRQGLVHVLEIMLRTLNGAEFFLSEVSVLACTEQTLLVELSNVRR